MELFSAAWVLPLQSAEIIRNGGVVIDGDAIVAVGPSDQLKKQHPQAQCRDFPDAVILPGLVNAHCHLDRTGFYERYTVETDTGLSSVAWFLEGLHYLSKTSSGVVAKKMEQTLTQMVASGITCVGAMVHYEGAFPILKSSPMRGVIFQEILSGPDRQAQQRFEVALALIEQYLDVKPGHLKIGFGPHSAYVLSKNLLNIISKHAKDARLPLQIHAAETFSEMEFFFESKGLIATQLFPAIGWEELPPAHMKTPVQHLEDIGFFSTPLSIVGGYHLSASDFPRLARNLAKVVYAPGANRRFRLGSLPLKQLMEHGIPVALGTEILSNAEGFDLWDEMRLALKEGSSPLPTPLELLKMATSGGAFALGFENEIGSLTAGKKADFIVVRKPACETDSPDTLCRELILQTQHSCVRNVYIAGKAVV
ncbi:MAG: amidohydrolase family protein [Deltaproteobacteria bacterium]|nr:amidohydrolase family protein [Deltaproteobacteria bacterium]